MTYIRLIPLGFLLNSLVPLLAFAQFAPPVGQPGTTAIFRDSSAFIRWASECSITRGYVNISDTTITYNGNNRASYGSYLYATGPADDLVVSLGDHGIAVLGFDIPVVNKSGPDFAVFENGFGDSFLELAFVEVSSDGKRYVRFPAISNVQAKAQVNTFDTLDATRIHNFAGKYRHTYGTPFDLEDLKDSTGIDLQKITSMRVIDVVGSIQSPFASFDSHGNIVNDPWPTPFDTGGFDLDAIGVIHNQTSGKQELTDIVMINLFPNPVTESVKVTFSRIRKGRVDLASVSGSQVLSLGFTGHTVIPMTNCTPGIYIATFIFEDGTSITKKIVKK